MAPDFKDGYFWVSITLLLVTIYFSVGTYLRWFDFGFVAGPYRFNHWLSWFGFLFILIHVPLFVTLKRRIVSKIRLLLGIHVLGNLTAFMLISIHFGHQIGRSAQFYPDLGTGVALYIIMPTLVATGFLQRFNILSNYRKNWKFLHTSLVVSLFLIIFIHILQGLQIV